MWESPLPHLLVTVGGKSGNFFLWVAMGGILWEKIASMFLMGHEFNPGFVEYFILNSNDEDGRRKE